MFRLLGYKIKKINKRTYSEAFEVQLRLIEGLKKKPDANLTVLDVGANIGQTAHVYRRLFPSAAIYCFEPFPDSATVIKQNNQSDERIHVIQQAVCDTVGQKLFYINQNDQTHSIYPRPESGRRYYPKDGGSKTSMEVPSMTLDCFARDEGLSDIDILKFDIQGGELLALEGAKELLNSQRISLIYTEVMFVPHYQAAPLFDAICAFLAQYKYTLFGLYDLIEASNGQLRFADAIFVSQQVRNAVIDTWPEED